MLFFPIFTPLLVIYGFYEAYKLGVMSEKENVCYEKDFNIYDILWKYDFIEKKVKNLFIF